MVAHSKKEKLKRFIKRCFFKLNVIILYTIECFLIFFVAIAKKIIIVDNWKKTCK